jgi:hypothetical protein
VPCTSVSPAQERRPTKGYNRLQQESRSGKDKRGIDVTSGALPFARLWYGEPNAVRNAINYAKFRRRSHRALICVHTKPGRGRFIAQRRSQSAKMFRPLSQQRKPRNVEVPREGAAQNVAGRGPGDRKSAKLTADALGAGAREREFHAGRFCFGIFLPATRSRHVEVVSRWGRWLHRVVRPFAEQTH